MNCIHPPSLTLPRCRYMGSAWLSRAASWCYRPVATDQSVEKQKSCKPDRYFVFRFPRLPRASSVAGWRRAYVSTDPLCGGVVLESFVLPKRCAIASLDTLRLGIKEAARGGFSGGLRPALLMLLLWRLGVFLCGSPGR